MIFPDKTDYPNGLAILDYRNLTDRQLYLSLIEGSASAYFESDPVSRWFLKRKFMLADALLAGRTFENLLDVGTGIGYFIPHLSLIARRVVGVDRSAAVVYAREMIKKRGIANATVEQRDVLSLPYPESSFDAIVFFSAADGFSALEFNIAFSSFRRLLKPDGVLLIGYSTENAAVRFLHRRMSFLFGKRLRTKQLLASTAADAGEKNARTRAIEQAAARDFGFVQVAVKNVSFLGLKLYRVVEMRNAK